MHPNNINFVVKKTRNADILTYSDKAAGC